MNATVLPPAQTHPDAGSAAPADLKALTSLRFLAAAWVVMFAAWPHIDTALSLPLAGKGYLGVEVFFILSGFILSHVYLQAFGEGSYRWKGFLWARIARVYPLHLVTLFGVALLGIGAGIAGLVVDPGLTDWRSLPAHLTMTQSWGLAPSAAFNHPSWSISAEWFAYLTFPAYAFVAWRLRHRPWLAIAAASIFMLALYMAFQALAGFSLTRATFQWGALRIVPCFAYGCALYLLHRRGIRHAGLVAGVGAVGVVLAASLGLPDPVTVLAAGAMILGLGGISNEQAGPLASPTGVYLGEISYSVYMVNAPVLLVGTNVAARLVGESADGKLPVWAVLAIVLMIPVVAAATYHLVEYPARRWLRALGNHRTAASAPKGSESGEQSSTGAAKSRTLSPERRLQPSESIV